MGAVPVVRIRPCEQHQCPGHDFVEINESDFDPDIHELFEAEGAKKASKGLNVDELKAALEASGIAIPEGAKKADLQALLDA